MNTFEDIITITNNVSKKYKSVLFVCITNIDHHTFNYTDNNWLYNIFSNDDGRNIFDKSLKMSEEQVSDYFCHYSFQIRKLVDCSGIIIYKAVPKKICSVDIIKKYWKRYRWNCLRNFAKRKYHPSKIDFTI